MTMQTSTACSNRSGNRFSFFLHPLAAVLLLVTGCASHSQPATKSDSNATPKDKPAPTNQAAAATNSAQGDFDIVLQKAAAQPSAPLEGSGWKSLFDGKTLTGWQISDFGGHGAIHCDDGLMVIEMGDALTGVNWTNGDIPTMNYEVALDAMKITGSDFFCGLTFPVADSHATLILGGWGGGVVGISSIDGEDASENETSKVMPFDTNRWYRVRLRVTDNKIQAWLDKDQIVNLNTTGKKISLRFGDIELSKPLGLATYQTTAAMRDVKIRRLDGGQ